YLTAIVRLVGVRERRGHPHVHAEVQVAHDEDELLEPLGEVERVLRHLEAFLDRAWNEEDLPRVAVRQKRRRRDVTLRGARRQPRRGTHALDVEDDARALG